MKPWTFKSTAWIVKPLIFSALCFFAASGCGYKLVGGGNLPAGIKSVSVSLFDNKSSETGFENTLAGYLNSELSRNGIRLVSNPEKADARLTGTIKSVSVGTVSYTGTSTTAESRVTVVIAARLKNRDGVEIWAADNMSDRQTYSADTDNNTSVRNKKAALAVIAQRLAEEFYGRLTEDF